MVVEGLPGSQVRSGIMVTDVRTYPSDLTDDRWEMIRTLIPASPPIGDDRRTSIRSVVNAIFYLSRAGCAWRMLPKDFPPWQTVYGYFARWKHDGTWQAIHDALRCQVRKRDGRQEQPSAAIVDSQSVKTTEKGGRTATMLARKSTAASDISS
jgi:putative transposase